MDRVSQPCVRMGRQRLGGRRTATAGAWNAPYATGSAEASHIHREGKNGMRRDAMSGVGVLPGLPLPAEGSAALPAEWRGRHHLDRPRPAITIALIGGQRLLRDATASLLRRQDGLQVLGTFATAAEFISEEWKRSPAVLLLDCDGGEPRNCGAALQELSPAAAHRGSFCSAAPPAKRWCAARSSTGRAGSCSRATPRRTSSPRSPTPPQGAPCCRPGGDQLLPAQAGEQSA